MHVLPNDPLFKKLEPLQIRWIIDNIIQDNMEQERAFKAAGKGGTTQTVENEDFEEMIRQRREKAKLNNKR